MNDDKPKSIWKKSWRGRSAVLIWCVVIGVVTFLAVFIAALGSANTPIGPRLVAAAVIDILLALCGLFFLYALFLYALLPFSRWLFWKHWQQKLFGLACLVTMIGLFYAEEDWRGKHDWEKFKRQWEAKGERFDFASVIPPAVPNDQNFAMAPIWVDLIEANNGTNIAVKLYGKERVELERAGLTNSLQMRICDDWDHSDPRPAIRSWEKGTLTDLKRWQNYYRTLAAVTNLFLVPPQPQSPAADVLLALSEYNSVIEELRQASRLPYSRFPLNYNTNEPWNILLPQLPVLKKCSQVLQLRAIAELQSGQSDKALADIKLALRLAESARNEPDLLSHLVRMGIVNRTLQPIYEGLAEHKWSDAQLAELDSKLAKFDFLEDCELVMRGERASDIGAVEYLRRTRDVGALLGLDSNRLRIQNLRLRLAPSGWFYLNELHIGRFYQEWYLPLINETKQTVSPTAVTKADAACLYELGHRTPENFLEGLLLPALGAAVETLAYSQEAVDLARVACALERYRLAHGEYPESLDVLAPRFIATLPHDIINGQPLHYRRTADGLFVLYSVGWNETDNGGTVVLNKYGVVDIGKGDWVWRYPAK